MARIMTLCTAALLAAGLLAGCNNAKSPSDVAKDVNSASQAAAEKVANAQGDVQSEQRDEQHVAATQQENVSKTEAEGDRKVALAGCEALSGDRQQACKDQANAQYDSRAIGRSATSRARRSLAERLA
ncbi:MAG TPA: hypothetical protein VLW26_08320 [Steroidobacteraceae bacterium]|nr:hypothetical protein [Steroidobacteraceae bacterium]